MVSDPLDIVRAVFDRRAATYDESTMHHEVADAVAEFATLSGVDAALISSPV